MNELIFDRTLEDVLYAIDNPDSTEYLKGCYNYTDLNRIESNCKYVMELRNKRGILKPIEIITKEWNMKDIPHINDFNRIRSNIISLMQDMTIPEYETIEFSNTIDYIKANILEKDLSIIKHLIETIEKEVHKCGTFYCGLRGLYAKPKEYIKIKIYSGTIRCGEEFRL